MKPPVRSSLVGPPHLAGPRCSRSAPSTGLQRALTFALLGTLLGLPLAATAQKPSSDLGVNLIPQAPTISDIPNQLLPLGTANTAALPFTIGDNDTPLANLNVTASSGNTDLVPNTGLALAGTAANRTITVTPRAGVVGTATITVTVSDGRLANNDTFNVVVAPFDFGDAPQRPYPVRRSNNGAAQRVQAGFGLGPTIDFETDGQPSANADGDGADEDGVKFLDPLIPARVVRVTITINPTAKIAARTQAWIDFNADGAWHETLERIFEGVLPVGDSTITFDVPPDAQLGPTFARFRVSLERVIGPAGLSTEPGEVEDYPVTIGEPVRYDFGDAPDPTFPTTLKNDGARHVFNPDVFMGQRIDPETDGQPNASASGDDLNPSTADDEDGVEFFGDGTAGSSLDVSVKTSTPGYVSAWVDFNGDGDWLDADEYVFRNVPVSPPETVLALDVPTASKEGLVMTRFRFCREPIQSFQGVAPDGEVEDHTLRITAPRFDFGDAPDPTFPTTLKNNGARHRFNPDVFLGQRIDPETDGQPNASATGDDLNPSTADDEDGVEFVNPVNIGQTATVRVVASTQGLLSAWIDFNQNGSWADTGERIFTNLGIGSGTNSLTFPVPAGLKDGSTFARFRFSLSPIESFLGESPNGEVEDHTVRLTFPQPTLDFGDAPDSYRTKLASDGARHTRIQGLNLGKLIDVESDGQPSADALGDDGPPGTPDDEDGIFFTTAFAAGQSASFIAEVNGTGRLDAWIDFNVDGDFGDAGERVLTAASVVNGNNSFNVAVPASATPGETFARFRLSRGGVKDYFGAASDGEVEDYTIRISAPKYDFGDAPEENTAYPTTLARKGAHHAVEPGFHLGKLIDAEPDGQPNGTATGDDAASDLQPDDEDGVTFLTPLVAGVTSRVEVVTTTRGRLDAWIDFNQNRTWNDAGEKIFSATQLGAGVNTLSFLVPGTVRPGVSFARFRFSQQGGLGPEGFGGVGEVEDYLVRLDRRAPCQLTCAGTDFWLTFPGNYAPDPANPVRPQVLLIGAPGTQVTLSIAGLGYNNVVNLPAAGFLNVTLPKGADLADANDLIENKGVHVTATNPVAVHALSQVKYTSDGFLALPTETLGTEYVVLAFGNVHTAIPELNGTQFAVVGTENDTTVTLVPPVVTGEHDAGFPYNIKLNAGQTYQLRNTNDAPRDLTGTLILADKPIGVFGSHQVANVQSKDVFFADYLVEQLPSIDRWGQDFFTRPLATRTAAYTVRVVAAYPNTSVFMNGALVATLQRGEFVDRLLNVPARILTTKPALAGQYSPSSDADGVVNADPFMVLAQQHNLFSRQIRFATAASGFLTHHINVIAPTAAVPSVQLDGAAFPAPFVPIGATGFSAATTTVTPGVHNITATQPVGVTVYGWNEYESYAWPACLFFGDTTPPELTCPQEEITVTLQAGGTTGIIPCKTAVPDLRSQVKAEDNCGFASTAAPPVFQDPAPGTLVGVGTHLITLSVADAQGNVGTCQVKFTVIDPNPNGELRIVCPKDISVGCGDEKGAFVEYEVLAVRGCTPVPVICDPPPGSFFPEGTTLVKCTLDDPDQPLTCSFNVTVKCGQVILDFIPTPAGTGFTLNWSGAGVLESTGDVGGQWTTVEGAKPPFEVRFEGRARFFRIRQ